MEINKKYLQTGILLVFIILLSSHAFAFGVGSAYHQDHPLEILPGQTTEITFNLQNPAGGEDIKARASITQGSEIMQLTDSTEIYSLPIGSSLDVKATVSAPSDAKAGDIYPVEITFTTVTTSESGTFGIGSSVGRKFNVIISAKPEEKPEIEIEKKVTPWAVYAAILILVIVIIWLILRKIKKKR